MLTEPDRVFLEQMRAKHTPGGIPHDQSAHGHRISFELLTPEQAQQMQDQMLGGDTWSQSQVDSIKSYTSERAETINALLYNPQTAASVPAREREEIKQLIGDVHSAMRPTPQPVRAFRRVSRQGLGLKPGEDFSDLIGRRFQNAGFSSMSVRMESILDEDADYDAILDVEIPEGTPAAYIDSISAFQGEHELLTDAGTVYEFQHPGEEVDGKPVIHAKVVSA